MSLLRDVLDGYLYYDEVQRLASEHGLPVSRTKDELVDELVDSGELDPDEVVAFLRVDDLRSICAELGVPSGAARGVLADRVADAMRDEQRPAPKKRKRRVEVPPVRTPVVPSPRERVVSTAGRPVVEPSPHPVAGPTRGAQETGVHHVTVVERLSDRPAPQAPPLSINLTLPAPPLKVEQSNRPEMSRAGWGFVGVVFTVVIAAVTPLSIYLLGTLTGSLLVLGVGVVLALALAATHASWSGWVDRRFQN